MIYKQQFSTEAKDWNNNIANSRKNREVLDKIDAEAKQKGQILFRFFTVPVADGCAIYQVIQVNKKTVKVQRCTGIELDEYSDMTIDASPNLPLTYVEALIKGRDRLGVIFS